MKALFLPLFVLMSCKSPEQVTCEIACDSLVNECAVAAFPTFDSCMDGCYYQEAAGASLAPLTSCMYEAECDLFRIAECSRAYEVKP